MTSRMFKSITKTWNPYVGCLFECYHGGCWARQLALGKLNHLPRYSDGFKPKLVPSELTKYFKPDEFVAVSLMGDISFATKEEILLILSRIAQFPLTNFLIQSKNPKRFWEWEVVFPSNVYLATTIETNRDYHLTKAPPPVERCRYLEDFRHHSKFLSIEPICDFDLLVLSDWVKAINPEIIEVGADNYNNNLPEPSWQKVESLLKNLRDICPIVMEKKGLERLKYTKRGGQVVKSSPS